MTRLEKFLWFAIMPSLVVLNWFLFRRLADQNYFLWYLKYGSVIGLATTFFRLFVDIEKFQEGLISSHPLKYIRDITSTVGLFVGLFGDLFAPGAKNPSRGEQLSATWDTICGVCLAIMVAASLAAWFVVAVPLNYLVTLIGGAPARMAFRFDSRITVPMEAPPLRRVPPPTVKGMDGRLMKSFESQLIPSPFVRLKAQRNLEEARKLYEPETPETPETPAPDKPRYQSRTGPFELTQALNALLLALVNIVYSRFAWRGVIVVAAFLVVVVLAFAARHILKSIFASDLV
jgi:hypothetical protein